MTDPVRAAGKLGRRPHDPTRARLLLAPRIDATVPAPPTLVDWLANVRAWPMYGNDSWGDCVFAMIGHSIEAYTTYGKGATVTVTEQDVLGAYSAVTGFNPNAGPPGQNPTDQGTVIQDALDYWRKTGIAGHKILAFAQVDHTNPAELKEALNLFGVLLVGVNFPASAMEQFNRHQAWDVVHNDGGVEGGHAIHVGHSQSAGTTYQLITWGAVEGMTSAWWGKYVDEAWVAVTEDWLSVAGTSPGGLDLHWLGEDFAALTGKPNPFPQPKPTPVPNPSPVPVPPVDSADRVLTAAIRAWLKAKGL